MSDPALTPQQFDAMVKPGRRERIIWTLSAIGDRIGRSGDFVRDVLLTAPGTPVKEIGGRYYAFEDDLISFLRFKNRDD